MARKKREINTSPLDSLTVDMIGSGDIIFSTRYQIGDHNSSAS
ncbi:hypothetical protein [Phototrophicus methaneseepsis]|nr:hypothetical protein [Phototrophicus methaneseepsis]